MNEEKWMKELEDLSRIIQKNFNLKLSSMSDEIKNLKARVKTLEEKRI